MYFQERQFIPGQQLFRDVGAQVSSIFGIKWSNYGTEIFCQNMCVKCDAARFQTTVSSYFLEADELTAILQAMACTGQSEVPSNTTQTQAFCLITNCLQVCKNNLVNGISIN